MPASRHIFRSDHQSIPRGLPAFWAIITVGYSLIVTYRFAVAGVVPGVRTAAGFAAVTAVWLELWDRNRTTVLSGFAVAIAFSLTLIGNGYVAAAAYRNDGHLAVGRSLLTCLFAYLFIWKLRGLRTVRSVKSERK